MATLDLNQANFEQVVTDNPMVIIDFWAPWCAPCKSFAPIFEQASEAHKDIVFAKLNTEREQAIATAMNIRSVPTLMVFRERVILYSQPGALPAGTLDDLISQAKQVDMAQVRKEIAERGEGGGGVAGDEEEED